jgi:hypothetical protein
MPSESDCVASHRPFFAKGEISHTKGWRRNDGARYGIVPMYKEGEMIIIPSMID